MDQTVPINAIQPDSAGPSKEMRLRRRDERRQQRDERLRRRAERQLVKADRQRRQDEFDDESGLDVGVEKVAQAKKISSEENPVDRLEGPTRDVRPPRQWRVTSDRITYYNASPEAMRAIPTEDLPRTAEIIPNGFVSAREVNKGDGPMSTGRYILGAAYDGAGNLLPEFRDRDERYRDKFTPGQNPLKVDAERLAAAERLAGRHVYLGDLKGHFGHFLLESLPRAWYLIDSGPDTRVIFHHLNGVTEFHLGFWKATFDALGLDISRVTFATRDLVADELVVPSCQYWVNWKGSPGFAAVFDHMRRRIAERWTGDRNFPRKIYLTRRQLQKPYKRVDIPGRHPRKVQGDYARMVVNEEVAEDLFAARGYEIVAPETLPFETQVMMISQATHVAGLTGSALHMILFNDNPETKLIALHTRPSKSQVSLEMLRKTRGYHIWCVKGRNENQSPILDGDLIDRALTEIL